MADYCTTADVKAPSKKSYTDLEGVIAGLITAASRSIDYVCNLPQGVEFVTPAAAAVRLYPGSGDPVQWMDVCTSITLVEVKDSPTDSTYTAWAATDWIAATGDPRRPDFNALPRRFLLVDPTGVQTVFTSGRLIGRRGFMPAEMVGSWGLGQLSMANMAVPTVRITARWGWADTVPPAIKQATIAIVNKWMKRGESAWADLVASNDVGQLAYTVRDDPHVMMMLARYAEPAV